MLEFYVESEFKRCQLRACPVGTHLEELAAWLRAVGYKQRPSQLLLRGAAHLGHWMAGQGVRTGERMDDAALAAFIRHVPTCTCTHPFAGRDRYHRDGARHLLTHWRRVGVGVPPSAPAAVAPVVEHFSAWMRQHRGVCESTLRNYVRVVQEFRAAVGEDATAYDAARVRAFVLTRARHAGRSRAQGLVNAVRMFLRFCAVAGACPAELAAAVPRTAHWKLAALPRYLTATDIERLVAVCAPTTAAGLAIARSSCYAPGSGSAPAMCASSDSGTWTGRAAACASWARAAGKPGCRSPKRWATPWRTTWRSFVRPAPMRMSSCVCMRPSARCRRAGRSRNSSAVHSRALGSRRRRGRW